MSSGIYKIVNTKNNKIYVGQSVDILKRWQYHKYESEEPRDRSYKSILHDAFRKYGIENFEFSIIEECDELHLDEKEKFWIDKLNSLAPNGYNILSGGQKNKRTLSGEYGSPMVFSRKNRCIDCGKIISIGGRRPKRCKECYYKHIESKIDLTKAAELVYTLGSMTKASEHFDVCANAIVKQFKKHNLPYKTKEIKKWYEEQNNK